MKLIHIKADQGQRVPELISGELHEAWLEFREGKRYQPTCEDVENN